MKKSFCPTIIDIEASGFGSTSYPIEIGVVKFNGERYCSLIQPDPTWKHWCENAEKMHGISRTQITDCGKPSHIICAELNIFLAGTTAYSDAWVHDSPWLTSLYFSARMNRHFYVSPIETIASEEQLLLWDNTKIALQQHLNIPRHRASGDAYLIQQTYVETMRLLMPESPPDMKTLRAK
jgi:hypothetical protein